jgi:hypothetical protein
LSKHALRIAAGGLGLVLAVAGSAAARSNAASTIRVSAPMTSAQETPAPTGAVANAAGTFTGTVTKSDTGAVLEWRLTFSSLTGQAIAAHIHLAARGQSAGVAVPLCAPCESPATGRANITNTVLEALIAGRAYANVHTRANTAGEIRGQVGIAASVRTSMNRGQEVPRPKGARSARGTFTAAFRKEGSSTTMTWRLTFSGLTGRALAAHIHLARRGKAGKIAVPLCAPCRSGVRGRATVKGGVLTALEAGRAYVNIHTRRNPAGEVRGQVAAVPLTVSS